MTGAYVRILRDGKWQNIEIEHLTEAELDEFAKDRQNEGWKWAKFLCKWMREHIQDEPTPENNE